MTHDEAFLQAIREAPDDDGPRLVYADWLDDHGQAQRAEFIRVQCELARGEEGPRAEALRQRTRVLLQAHWEEWVGPLREATRPTDKHFLEAWMACGFHPEGMRKFHRGFVDTLPLDVEDFLARGSVLARLVPLRCLSLRGAAGRGAALAACGYLNGVETLAFVDYFSNPLTADDVRALAGSPHLGRLRELYLHHNNLGDAGVEALASAPWLSGLRTLNLTDTGLSSAGVRALAASPHAKGLTVLRLGRNDLTAEAVAALISSSFWAGLETLALNECRIVAEGLAALAAAPAGGLRKLELYNNPLGADGAEALAGAACLRTVTLLHLGHCQVGDAGAEALARSPNLDGVQTLALNVNGITDRGGQALVHSPYLRRLHDLVLLGNPVSDATLSAASQLGAGRTNLFPGP